MAGRSARRELARVLVFTMRGETIQAVHVITDPAKLGCLNARLTTPARQSFGVRDVTLLRLWLTR